MQDEQARGDGSKEKLRKMIGSNLYIYIEPNSLHQFQAAASLFLL